MKNVFICSPLGGRRACAPDFAANLENAKRYGSSLKSVGKNQ